MLRKFLTGKLPLIGTNWNSRDLQHQNWHIPVEAVEDVPNPPKPPKPVIYKNKRLPEPPFKMVRHSAVSDISLMDKA